MLWVRWFAFFLPLYQIGGLVLFRGDRRRYGGGFGMGILRGKYMVVCGSVVYWVYDFVFVVCVLQRWWSGVAGVSFFALIFCYGYCG